MKEYEKIMDSGSELILSVMQYHLLLISIDLNEQLMNSWKSLNEDEKYLTTDNVAVNSGLQKNMAMDMMMAFSEITNKSNEDAINEVGLNIVSLAERPDLNPQTLYSLPSSQVKRIKHQAELFTEAMTLDLQQATFNIIENNYMLTQKEISAAIDIGVNDFLEGLSSGATSFLQSAGLVNDSRSDVFTSDEGKKNIQAFQFYNPDPVTDLCSELNGSIFTADDPNYGLYICPLHYNCKSTYLPIRGEVNEDEISGLPELSGLSEKAQSQKQF